jgi:hypothetical protein
VGFLDDLREMHRQAQSAGQRTPAAPPASAKPVGEAVTGPAEQAATQGGPDAAAQE